ncbi:MAG: hypothetical protein N2654_07650 [Deltaproteobacteria bacterium]|nr:hypothetical protein [Deltaproteobacteria bacterium]
MALVMDRSRPIFNQEAINQYFQKPVRDLWNLEQEAFVLEIQITLDTNNQKRVFDEIIRQLEIDDNVLSLKIQNLEKDVEIKKIRLLLKPSIFSGISMDKFVSILNSAYEDPEKMLSDLSETVIRLITNNLSDFLTKLKVQSMREGLGGSLICYVNEKEDKWFALY